MNCTVPLKTVVELNPQTLAEDTPGETTIQYVDIGSVSYERGIESVEAMLFAEAPSRARRVVRVGDVIVSTVRTYLRAVAQIRPPHRQLIVSTGFAVLRALEQLDARFLYYSVLSQPFIEAVQANSVGVSYPAIDPGTLLGLRLRLPTLPEQRAAAAYLDRETAGIDTATAALDRLDRLLAERAQRLLDDEYDQKATPSYRIRHLVARIEQGWSPPAEDRDAASGEWGVLKTSSVGRWGFDSAEHKVLPTGMQPRSALEVKPGDFLMVRGSGSRDFVARAAIVGACRRRLMLCDLLYRLTIREDLVWPEYLLWFLRSRTARSQIEASLTGTVGDAMKVRRDVVLDLTLPLPSLSTQQSVAARLAANLTWTLAATQRIEYEIALLQERRRAVITAAVAGEVDVEGAA